MFCIPQVWSYWLLALYFGLSSLVSIRAAARRGAGRGDPARRVDSLEYAVIAMFHITLTVCPGLRIELKIRATTAGPSQGGTPTGALPLARCPQQDYVTTIFFMPHWGKEFTEEQGWLRTGRHQN